MSDGQSQDEKLSLSDVEEIIHAHCLKWAKENTSLPVTAFRVMLWPGDFDIILKPGPTATITVGKGSWPGTAKFWPDVKAAILRVWHDRLYSTMAVESVALIMRREADRRRWLKKKYNFDPELIPHMLGDNEVTVRFIERVEVIHKDTGMREVVEVEPGRARTTYAAKDIAKMRLARRVHEARAVNEGNEIPFPKPA